MITGLVKVNLAFAVVAGLGIVIGVVYMLVSYRKTMLGHAVELPFCGSEFPGKICVCPDDRLDFFNRDFSDPVFESDRKQCKYIG